MESWPRQGSIVNGHAFLQVHWEPVTKGTDGGLSESIKNLPTPTTQDFKRRGPNSKQQGLSNTENWAMLPTPVATDYRGRSGQGFIDRHGAKRIADVLTQTGDCMSLNPSFVEEMMGYPIGYTDLKH